MKVALVHDYLNQRGGAERVFAHIARAWPDAPIYTALYDEGVAGNDFPAARVRRSYLARVPMANRYFRALAPFYPRAFETFDLSAYDAIVSSTTSWAKGVRFPSSSIHVCYVNTVSRFAFAYEEYVAGLTRAPLVRPLVDRLVAWDRAAAMRPTRLVANSRNVAARIRTYYGRRRRRSALPGRRRSLHRWKRRRRLLSDRVASTALQAHRARDPRRGPGRRQAGNRRHGAGRRHR